MNISKGYWRLNDRSEIIVNCFNKENNCEGGAGNFTCSVGHEGALCESCGILEKYWEDK